MRPANRIGAGALLVTAFTVAFAAGAASPAEAATARTRFEIRLTPGESSAEAIIRVRQNTDALREIRIGNEGGLEDFRGDGVIIEQDDDVLWRPPATGGELRYRVEVDRRRQGRHTSGYDAIVTKRWALFRGDRVFPVRSWRRLKNAEIEAELVVGAPAGWSTVTPYQPDAKGRLAITNPGERMTRPVGWIITGDVATRTDEIDGMTVSVSAPRGYRMQRIGTLAVLRWTLPTLLPHFPGRAPPFVSIVSAGSPMWLGALSAPNSVFVHAERPLISGNGTSTIVHEMLHILLAGIDVPRNQDWIDEGLAEYFSLWAMRQSGTISDEHYDAAIAHFRDWSKDVKSLKTRGSSGPVTARAVTVFHALDRELRESGEDRSNLFEVIDELRDGDDPIDLAALRAAAKKRLGKPSAALSAANVPGFD